MNACNTPNLKITCISLLELTYTLLQTGRLKIIEMYCLETIKSEIKVLAGLVPPEDSKRESIPCLFLASGDLSAIFGIPWLTYALL